jgi:hypothetical protein
MLSLKSKSPVDLSRQAKFITTIKLGDPKLVDKYSHNLFQEGKHIIPDGVETLNQSWSRFCRILKENKGISIKNISGYIYGFLKSTTQSNVTLANNISVTDCSGLTE